jgi:flagellar hook-basal body complex protein FliE
MNISPTSFSSAISSLASTEGLQSTRSLASSSASSTPFQLPKDIELQGVQKNTAPLQSLGIHEPTTFGQLMHQVVRDVNQVQQVSGEKVRDVLQGGKTPIHEAMIAVEESGVAFTMLTEMRNKLLESYQEVMRIPV